MCIINIVKLNTTGEIIKSKLDNMIQTGNTRIGNIRYWYGEYIEPRPFTRFTNDDKQKRENEAWAERAMEWAKRCTAPQHVSKQLTKND